MRVRLARFAVISSVLLAMPLLAQQPDAASADATATKPAESAAPAKAAQPPADYSLSTVLQELRQARAASKKRLDEREAQYQARLQDAQQRLAKAQATLTAKEAEGKRLDQRFEGNKVELNDKTQLLKDKIGALKELFGVFQQNASDLIGAFNGSPTSIEYPDRDRWLEGFANRMKNASEVSSTQDINVLWFEMMREIAASDDIVRLQAPVLDADGKTSREREIVRVGTFNLISNDPQPEYLVWRAGPQQAAQLPRQPSGPYLDEIDAYLNGDGDDLHQVSVDPTAGVLLSLLIEKPTLRERIDQGGLVGYMILGLGVLALILALLKLIDITVISLRVSLQQRNLDKPSASNALGRLLQTYQNNVQLDPETLEMRLHDRVQKESNRVHRFAIFLAIIAAVAPLMGLLGTVVGMINTFQAITLYGTGDPQTMAGGISQALITTVLGLVVAVPAVLLHAVVKARATGVVNLLKTQSAALTADGMQVHSTPAADTDSASLTPSPA